MTEKLEGLATAGETAVVEMEELQGVIAEGQERGFLTAEALAAAVEDAELSAQQTQDLASYLEEHGIEVVGSAESTRRAAFRTRSRAREPSDDREPLAGGEREEEPAEDEPPRATTRRSPACSARLEELKRPRGRPHRRGRASTRCACTCARSGACRC